MNDPWSEFLCGLHKALSAFVCGNPEPYKALWSRSEDVSILGAFGGYERGWRQVGPRLDWAASQYRDGTYTILETISKYVGADLAYRVHTERIRTYTIDGDEVLRERRVTHVFRCEGGAWQIIHQHSDPVLVKQAPK